MNGQTLTRLGKWWGRKPLILVFARGISESKMLDCLARLGRDIDIVVKPARRGVKADTAIAAGRVNVVFA